MSGHTPGPWYAHHCFAGKNKECWCMVVGTTPDPTHKDMDSVVGAGSCAREDAYLIAAAPGMLDALKIARDEIEQSIKDRFWTMGKEYLTKEHIERNSVLKMIDRVLADAERASDGEKK